MIAANEFLWKFFFKYSHYLLSTCLNNLCGLLYKYIQTYILILILIVANILYCGPVGEAENRHHKGKLTRKM